MNRMSTLVIVVAVVFLGAVPVSVGATTHRAVRPTTKGPPSLIALPVITCSTTYANGTNEHPFVARQLPATSFAKGLSFYSNGLITVLGPAGWTCGALVAGDGGQRLDVYPPGRPDYSLENAPPGTELIQVDAEYTGHIPGADLVCGLFPHSAAASSASSGGETCPQVPPNQKSVQLTPDVITYLDPPGVSGTGAGSGGSLVSIGAVVYPQLAFPDTSNVNISLLSCTLTKRSSSLCLPIEGEFLARNPPNYVPQSG